MFCFVLRFYQLASNPIPCAFFFLPRRQPRFHLHIIRHPWRIFISTTKCFIALFLEFVCHERELHWSFLFETGVELGHILCVRVALWFFIYLVTTILKAGPGSNVIDLNPQFQSHHRAWKMSLVLYIQYSNRKLNSCNFLDIDKQKPPIRGLPDTSGGNFPPMQPTYKDLIGLASLKWPPGKLSLTGLIIKTMGYLYSTTHWTPFLNNNDVPLKRWLAEVDD